MIKHSVNFLAGLMVSLLCFTASAPAAPLQLSQVPLYLGGNIGPNVMFTLDDSGSMHWETLPESVTTVVGTSCCDKYLMFMFPRAPGVYSGSGPADDYNNNVPDFDATNKYSTYARSYYNNKLYYDPSITYTPWSNADGTLFPNAVTTAAHHNPADTAKGYRDLTVDNTRNARWLKKDGTFTSSTSKTFYPATYFRYNGGNVWTPANYTKVEIKSANGPFTGEGRGKRSDCASGTCTHAQEIQNFANWYTYYRSRVLTARAGVGRAFAAQSSDPTSPSILRVGFGAINVGSATIDGQSSPGTVVKGVRRFTDIPPTTDRTDFFTSLYGHAIPTSGTPLRKALDEVGQYFETHTGPKGPWAETPGTASTTPQLTCRQSYNILTTDGYWNGARATPAAQANVDNTVGTPIDNHTLNPSPLSYQYDPARVENKKYKDAWGNPNPPGGTLADVAMYYWNRDLRTNLLNKVVPNAADNAFWQHMVTHTVGLGVVGTLNPTTDLPALTAGTTTWPRPWNSNAPGTAADPLPPASWQIGYNLDDLWHAAVNGHGQFFSADDPVAFADSLTSILNTIVERNSSAASVALNSGSITSDSHLYQATFNTSNWSGQLLAIPIKSNGTIPLDKDGKPIPDWDAAVKLDALDANDRKIVTYKPSATGTGSPGIAFRWPTDPAAPTSTELDPAQISALNTNPVTGSPDVPTPRGSERLDHLRGKAVSGFRTRKSKLGDSVYSSPAFVGAPQAHYNLGKGGEFGLPYSVFKSSKRDPMVYVGANDGMLHAFDAKDGTERFAYVPASVFKNLNKLTDPDYNHRFYVDGSPIVGDAFFGTPGTWHTVLVGALRGGGQGIYALDITAPPSALATEADIAAKVLWEFTDSNDPDLGYTYSDPNIVRMHNGKWAAVFGNGYNNTEGNTIPACTDSDEATLCTASTNGNAVLYIVDIENGNLIAKLDTKKGYLLDPMNSDSDPSTSPLTDPNRPNGLATPAPIDANGDYIVDYIYAGDLFGNLWKFDVTSSNEDDWKVAYGSTTTPDPLFTACAGAGCTTGGSSNYQPITTRPQVGRHPTVPNGFLVYFGTGKYLESGDGNPNTTPLPTTQSFYGIWDKNATSFTAFGRDKLVEQVILKELPGTYGGFSYDLRVTTKKPVNWTTKSGWYMDLVNQGVPLNNKGEKQVTDSILRNDRIVFTTLVPSVDPCDFGGTGWLMELDAATGGQLDYAPFDLDQNNTFDQKDYVEQEVTADFDGDGTPETRKVPPSGKRSKEGIIARPGVVAGTGINDDKEYKFSSGSTGKIERTVENAGPGPAGRTSWRELKQ